MPRVADIGFDKSLPQRRDGLVAIVLGQLHTEPQVFTEAATWLHETWTESAVGKLLAARDLDRRRRSLGSPSGSRHSRRPKVEPLQLPGDQLRADRLEHAIRWLLGKNQGQGVLRLLGGNQSKSVLSRNALRAVLVAACVVDPDAGEWLGAETPLASAPWESSQPKGRSRIRGRSEVCHFFGNDALALMEEAMEVLGWRSPSKPQSPLGKPPLSTTSGRWPVTPEMMSLVRTKMREIVFNRDVEDAVRVDAGLTLLSCLGLQLLPGKQELPSPLEHQETLDVWRALDEPLGRLAILAESRGIDSTPLRELVPCRTFAEVERLRTLVERLDVVAQAQAAAAAGGGGATNAGKGKKRKKRNRPLVVVERPLTAIQVNTMEVVARHKRNFAAAAAELKRDPKTVRENYLGALAKLARLQGHPSRSVKTAALPTDRRGQENVRPYGKPERGG